MKKVLYILGELSDLDVDWLTANGRKDQVAAGTVLITEGKPIDAVFIVLDGLFRVSIPSRGDGELARLGVGEIIGEISLVDGRPASASVKALEAGSVLAISRKKLDAKLKQDTGFAARFYRAVAVFLSVRLRRTSAQAAHSKVQASPDEKENDVEGDILDKVHLAGARFDRMLKKLMGN